MRRCNGNVRLHVISSDFSGIALYKRNAIVAEISVTTFKIYNIFRLLPTYVIEIINLVRFKLLCLLIKSYLFSQKIKH